MDAIELAINTVARLRPSTIEFVTSAGADAGGGEAFTVGLAAEGIKLKDNRTGQTKWLVFAGAGGGIGVGFPIGGSMSTPDFPSHGSRILRGPTNWGTLELSDLVGTGQIITGSASAGAGAAGSLVFFNVTLVPPPLPPVLFKAALWVEGICLGIPGVGVMGYTGVWTMTD